jgi:lipopolysaccharide transport system ATP-binding protein
MSDIAVRVEGVGKRYRIGTAQRETMLREAIVRGLRSATRRASSALRRGTTTREDGFIWALHDVGFEVARGEAVGIIGGNGAGKSTLLKILSRITEPTVGDAWIRGRVGSLLEVGTGFHPELTGRENTYLNGAVLGMRRTEIAGKFDEIVAFAGVEQFIDTPVKHYSSGMYLRLAFAVAAHLEPEILIVDEVLAVGDAEFQRKCLGRMNEVTSGGRTVLFVSHNMDAVQRLCSRCVLLEKGRVAAVGPAGEVVRGYLARDGGHTGPGEWVDVSEQPRRGSGEARFVAAHYNPSDDAGAGRVVTGGPLELTVVVEARSALRVDSLAATLYSANGTKLVNADTSASGQVLRLERGRNDVVLRIEALHLNPGTYPVGLWLATNGSRTVLDHVESAFELRVEQDGSAGFGATPASDGHVPCRFHAHVGGRVAEGSTAR